MQDRVKVLALQDVVVMDGRGSRVLERGQVYELGRVLVDDLMRAGYVTEAENSAADGPDAVGVGDKTGEGEYAAVEAPERAVVRKGQRRRAGGEL